jgi:hypothetical protein
VFAVLSHGVTAQTKPIMDDCTISAGHANRLFQQRKRFVAPPNRLALTLRIAAKEKPFLIGADPESTQRALFANKNNIHPQKGAWYPLKAQPKRRRGDVPTRRPHRLGVFLYA